MGTGTELSRSANLRIQNRGNETAGVHPRESIDMGRIDGNVTAGTDGGKDSARGWVRIGQSRYVENDREVEFAVAKRGTGKNQQTHERGVHEERHVCVHYGTVGCEEALG
mmetsp:Transcript_51273/g.51678  ORF Transcript_51273/g.51678 Transcript_51273/m.51678 type:complete len:110 (-) Transcript_51273:911-1240(-)